MRRRIKSVKNTQQITKAMKMVAAAKLKRAQDRVTAARPFAGKMTEVLGGLSCQGRGRVFASACSTSAAMKNISSCW